MSTQVNYYRQFPFKPFVSTVTAGQEISAKEATRLWWLPRRFKATMHIDVPSYSTTQDVEFDDPVAPLERQLDGAFEDERALVRLSNVEYLSQATFLASQEFDPAGFATADIELHLFVPTLTDPPGIESGVWTDGEYWAQRSRVRASIGFVDNVNFFIGSYDDAIASEMPNVRATTVNITYKPEAPDQPYTRPPSMGAYLYSYTDLDDITFTIDIEELHWFQHNGVWSETAGSVRLREP